MNLIVSSVATAVACTAIALVMLDRGSRADARGPAAEAPLGSEPAAVAAPPASPGSVADVTARCLPAVVNISTRRAHQPGAPGGHPFFDLLRPFRGGGGPDAAQSLGSGVIVDPEGLVLTNQHVIADATEIRVTLSDGREYEGRAVGSDPESDLAMLRLESEDDEPLQLESLPYGDSASLRQGDPVLAIGNPFGVGQTVTRGIVSATGRASMGITDYEDFIQTDAAINPGNSGGALVNLRGELIGINTAILSRTGGSHGIGFAIPSNMAGPIAAALEERGEVTRGWLGVALQDLSPRLARSMGIRGRTQGAVVMDVEARGPAADADLQRGDLITELDSETIRSSRQLRNLIATRGAGAVIQLNRLRADQALEVQVTLRERPAPAAHAPSSAGGAGDMVAGLTVTPLTDALRRRYGAHPGTTGVVVVDAEESGPGPAAGVRVGDVVMQAAGQPVDSPATFRRLYEGSFFVVMVQVERAGANRVFFVGR